MIAPCLDCGRTVRGPATQDPWLCSDCQGRPRPPRCTPNAASVAPLAVALTVMALAGAVLVGAVIANQILRRFTP